jgi:hypothetical protein
METRLGAFYVSDRRREVERVGNQHRWIPGSFSPRQVVLGHVNGVRKIGLSAE